MPWLYPLSEDDEVLVVRGLPKPAAPLALPLELSVKQHEKDEDFEIAACHFARYAIEHIVVREVFLRESLEIATSV